MERNQVKIMRARSGAGLMSYPYKFIQIGGYKGMSNDPIVGSEPLLSIDDENIYRKVTVLDCRNGKCKEIHWDEFETLWNNSK